MHFRTTICLLSAFSALFLLSSFPGSLYCQDEWGQLQNFEDRDLSRWKIKGSGKIALDSVYATERQKNLRAELGPGSALEVDLRGLWRMEEIIRQKFSDEGGGGWKIYEAFFTDIYAGQPTELLVTFRDSLQGEWQSLKILRKGLNHLQFRREELKGVNFNSLASVEYAPALPSTLYFDHVRTWEYQPELEARNRMDIIYSDSIESPHVAWQKPDAAGPIKGLFVPSAGAGRVMVELMQRFDLAPTTVTFEPSLGLHRWAFGDFYGTRALGYDHVTNKFSISYTSLTSELESDKPFQVIVLTPLRGAQNWPPELMRALVKRVSEGCGLVLFQPTGTKDQTDLWNLSPLKGDVRIENYRPRETDQEEERPAGAKSGAWKVLKAEHYITRGIPLELLPAGDIKFIPYTADPASVVLGAEDGNPILSVGNYGKGRVAALAWADQGMFPVVDRPLDEKNGLPYWEYIYSLIGRTIRWAAGHNSEAGIYSAALESSPQGSQVAVSAELKGMSKGDMVQITLRDHRWQALSDTTATGGPGKLKVAFPGVIPSNLIIAEIHLLRPDRRVVDFSTVSRLFPAETSIASLQMDREALALGEQATGRVTIQGKPARVIVSLTDNRDRLLALDTLDLAPGKEARFALSTAGCLSRRAAVTARVVSGGPGSLDSRDIQLFIDRPGKWDDYEVMMYRFMPMIVPGEWKFLDRYMESLGVTAWAAIDPEFTFRSNLGIQAETRLDTEESLDGEGEKPYRQAKSMYLKTRDKKYLVRAHCLHDPAYLAEQKKVLEGQIGRFKRFSPLSYYIYEEPSYTHYGDAFDLCFGPYCMKAFREWLKGEYGTLEALNRQWGTSFRDWDSVIPDDTYEAQARGNYSSWADHRTFAEKTYAENYAYVRSVVRSIDPDGLVMMTGTQRTVPHNGYDYYLLDQTIDHTQPYGEPERHKAFMRQGGKITGCTGYGVFGPKLDYEIWSRLFYGHTAGSAIFWQFSTIDPDYRLSKSGRDMMETFGEIRHSGISRLISSASWTPSDVVIFWSMPSIHGTWIQDGRITVEDGAPSTAFERWEFNYESWRWLLEDLGVPYRAMSYQMLDLGWLEKSGAKILLLPNTIAISAKGIASIERFVSGGGAVIGDAQVALMDSHCKWLKNGSLAKVFGIRGEKIGTIQSADNTIRHGQGWGLREADPGIRADGSEKIEFGQGLPAVYYRTNGSGAAYYLNAFMAGYGILRQNGRGEALRRDIASLLEKAGYKPLVEIKPSSGDDLTGIKLVTYNLGDKGFLIGLVKDYRLAEPPRDIEISLPLPGYHYDIRAKQYLGRGSKIHTTIATGEIKLLASLPYPVESLKLELTASSRLGEEVPFTVEVEPSTGVRPGPHVFVIEVFDPQGRKLGWYGGNVAARDGKAESSFHTALDDLAGRWRVRARDVASGVAVEKYLTVSR